MTLPLLACVSWQMNEFVCYMSIENDIRNFMRSHLRNANLEVNGATPIAPLFGLQEPEDYEDFIEDFSRAFKVATPRIVNVRKHLLSAWRVRGIHPSDFAFFFMRRPQLLLEDLTLADMVSAAKTHKWPARFVTPTLEGVEKSEPDSPKVTQQE